MRIDREQLIAMLDNVVSNLRLLEQRHSAMYYSHETMDLRYNLDEIFSKLIEVREKIRLSLPDCFFEEEEDVAKKELNDKINTLIAKQEQMMSAIEKMEQLVKESKDERPVETTTEPHT